jgi:DNA invertase Pin-like site-specific DNA recombinase
VRKAPTRSPEQGGAVIGYVRVSTSEQADSGLGLAAQRASIAAYAAQRGWRLADVYEDAGASAKALKGRLGLAAALDALATGKASVLVVSKLDRLARSVADFAGLVRRAEREGWALAVVDLQVDMSTPTGGLLANVTASVAEWERKVIGQRTKDALAVRRSEGVRLGRPRLLDPVIAKRIRRSRARGRTLQSIADDLNEAAITTATGRTWSPALVRKVALQQGQ